MKAGIIECAFIGTAGRDPTRRTSQRTGRDWVSLSIAVGDEDSLQWLDVAAFGPAVDQVMQIAKGDRLYCEGKISMRTWQNEDGTSRTTLSVAANLVQPMGKIGERKPKKTRPAKETKPKPKPNVHEPLPFDDALPI